jgi:hypothetical protein
MDDLDISESGGALFAFPTAHPASETLKRITNIFLNKLRLFFNIFFKFPTDKNFDHTYKADFSPLFLLE